ncbi:MAG: ABC transporter ATP-binding protein [Chitinivibrionales bacterium]|nr:ABC transporter ATP-binding protein [Chitinivibrionales bacterium]
MADTAVTVNSVSKSFSTSLNTVKALDAVSFSVATGESVALLGANGAGKTTLFNILLGLLKPDSGGSSIIGVESLHLRPDAKARIGFIADHASAVPWSSAYDISRLFRLIYPMWDQAVFDGLIQKWNIDYTKRLNALSKGQKRLAQISLTLACRPSLLLLDEPFNGLDAVMRMQVQKLLRACQHQQQVTLVYATHLLTEVPAVADRILILKSGKLAADSTIAALPASVEQTFAQFYEID